jgi:hypothetical protein
MPGSRSKTIYWKFSPVVDPATGERKVVVEDVDGRVENGAVISFNRDRKGVRVRTWRVIRGRKESREQSFVPLNPVLVRNCLAPLAWPNCSLPFVYEQRSRSSTLKEYIGSACFVSHLKVCENPLTMAEAVALGMIDDRNRGLTLGKELYLLELTRKVGERRETVLQQLWAAGDDFWLYEKQGYRCSWREQ